MFHDVHDVAERKETMEDYSQFVPNVHFELIPIRKGTDQIAGLTLACLCHGEDGTENLFAARRAKPTGPFSGGSCTCAGRARSCPP